MSSSSSLCWHTLPLPLAVWSTQWSYMAYGIADGQLSIVDSLSTTNDRIKSTYYGD